VKEGNVLYEPTPAMVNCLGGCNEKFLSRDKFTNRICPACSRKSCRTGNPRTYSSTLSIDEKAQHPKGESGC
jgi:hypothetical protein